MCGFYICKETLRGSKNAQTETKNTDQFWNMILSE